MSEVKMLKSVPVAAQAQSEEIKAHYAKVFRMSRVMMPYLETLA